MDTLHQEIFHKLKKIINIDSRDMTVINTKNINIFPKKNNLIINFEIINNVRRINKFHESVNCALDYQGLYVSCAETLEERRKRVWRKAIFGFRSITRIIDFMYKRVLPKLPILKNIYFIITRGNNRVLSKAEILGRLISCGFDIVDYFEYNNLLYVISKKNRKPDFNMNPSYGPFFKMKRIGYRGETIDVYKLRTMYPYSEYCQDLIVKKNKLANSGKVLNDFRVTTWGKFFRKFWIDELPMFINFFKLELNLVGVRPLSENYFMKYPPDLRELRIKFKPGLIPPYYADLPKNFEQILDSERKYLKSKVCSPVKTDIRYFLKAVVNIVFKGARSS